MWDLKVKMTGQQAYLQEVETQTTDIWGIDEAATYGSKEPIYLIVDWTEARLHLSIVDMSEENDEGLEASARFCDDISKGDIIEIDVYDDQNLMKTVQKYKVTMVRARVHIQPFSKKIWIVPYRSDNQ